MFAIRLLQIQVQYYIQGNDRVQGFKTAALTTY